MAEMNAYPDFIVTYSSRDVILYALSVGFGSSQANYDCELQYLYEDHPDFVVTPIFCLSLPFLAVKREETANETPSTNGEIPSFPPPLMRLMGTLPARFIRSNQHHSNDLLTRKYPVIHTSHAITWTTLKFPIKRKGKSHVILDGDYISVTPKAVGTFVCIEIRVYQNSNCNKELICTMHMSYLLLGFPSELVIPYGSSQPGLLSKPSMKSIASNRPILETEYTVNTNATLLYRLASGDSNRIHADPSQVPLRPTESNNIDNRISSSRRPLLHGLCTMGIVGRYIMEIADQAQEFGADSMELTSMQCSFTKPVFAGDTLLIRIWDGVGSKSIDRRLLFSVWNQMTNELVLDHGVATLKKPTFNEAMASRL